MRPSKLGLILELRETVIEDEFREALSGDRKGRADADESLSKRFLFEKDCQPPSHSGTMTKVAVADFYA
jgi:hypothetical protein